MPAAASAARPLRRQGFADYLNSVLNRTVTDARLVENGERVAFALHGVSERLFVRQAIEVVGDRCQTVSYAYRYQSGDDKGSWRLRWEYFRERPRPDYEYPPAHVHANAESSIRDRRRTAWQSRRGICTSRRRACRSSWCSGMSEHPDPAARRPAVPTILSGIFGPPPGHPRRRTRLQAGPFESG